VVAVLALLAATILPALLLQSVLASSWLGLAVLALLASTLSAARSLDTHVAAVAAALETGGLPAGRVAVSQIVGRDPDALEEAGVCRAAVESLAENFSDGVVAPLLWFAIAGLPGMLAYKAINTADSMIGHRTPRHEAFGWAAARLDDVVNLPASRLSGVLLALAACVLPGASPANAMRAIWRDAGKHRSPNAGWPEAAMAGALDMKIAGPRAYHGQLGDFAYMGDGRADLTAADIRRALKLYRIAIAVGWVAVVGAAVVLM
jgi:adenosylcobinamide-phosphate synthase